jgi:hypothetical protein
LQFIDKAAELITDRYWEFAESYIRPIIKDTEPDATKKEHTESLISRFKIASIAELTIVDVQPIVIEGDEQKEKRENANFAWYVAYALILDFSEVVIENDTLQFLKKYKEHIPDVDISRITPIFEEHIEWLVMLDPDVQLPIISNAQTWRLFYFSLMALQGQIKLPSDT